MKYFPYPTYRSLLVFYRNFKVFTKTWITNIAFNFIEPLFYLGALGFGLGAYVQSIDGISYLQWVAPALLSSSSMWAAASECTYDSYVRMSYRKVFQSVISTPISVEEVAVGEILFGAFKSVLYGTIFLLVISCLGLVHSGAAILVPLVLILSGLCFSELGMIWTGIVPNIDSFSYFFTLVITPMFLFSGIFFPIDRLPEFIKILAWFSPLYHAVEVIRPLVLGQGSLSLIYHIAWLLTFVVLLSPLPVALLKRRLIV